jgi:hypothetical protein
VKHLTFILTTFLIMAVALIAPVSAQAQTKEWTQGVCVVGEGREAVATIQGLQCLIGNVLSVAITGIGLAGFVMMLVGSFTYLLSGGNAKGIEQAKGTMTMAIAGLLVALSAFIILNIVSAFTGTGNLFTNFVIPGPDYDTNVIRQVR